MIPCLYQPCRAVNMKTSSWLVMACFHPSSHPVWPCHIAKAALLESIFPRLCAGTRRRRKGRGRVRPVRNREGGRKVNITPTHPASTPLFLSRPLSPSPYLPLSPITPFCSSSLFTSLSAESVYQSVCKNTTCPIPSDQQDQRKNRLTRLNTDSKP